MEVYVTDPIQAFIPAATVISRAHYLIRGVASKIGWMISIEWVSVSTWLWKFFSAKVNLWWALTRDSNILTCLTKRGRSIHILLDQSSWHQFFSHVPSKSLTVQPNHWPQNMNQYVVSHVAISLSMQNKHLDILLEVLPTGRISFPCSLSGISQKEATLQQLCSSGWHPHIIQNHL